MLPFLQEKKHPALEMNAIMWANRVCGGNIRPAFSEPLRSNGILPDRLIMARKL
jgi:hypothetical protein